MKKIKAKLEEAKQFIDLIQSNAEKSIEKSKILLANTIKTNLSLKKTKQSFLNTSNSIEENNISINELKKAINDYIKNPTKQNLKLVKNKNNISIDKINIFSSNFKIFNDNFSINQDDFLENNKITLETLQSLKKTKVNINKLKNNYLKRNQLILKKLKKYKKNKINLKSRRIIFNILNTTPEPESEICKSIKEKIKKLDEDNNKYGKELIKLQKNKKFNNLVVSFDENIKNIMGFQKSISDLQNNDLNAGNIKSIQEYIDKLEINLGGIRVATSEIKKKEKIIKKNNEEIKNLQNQINKNTTPSELKEINKKITRLETKVTNLHTEIGIIYDNEIGTFGIEKEIEAQIENLKISAKGYTPETVKAIEEVEKNLKPLFGKEKKLKEELKKLGGRFRIEELNELININLKEIDKLKGKLSDNDCSE